MPLTINSKPNVYTRCFWSKLCFLKANAVRMGMVPMLVLVLKLVRAKAINLACAWLEQVLPHRVQCSCCGWTGLRFRTIFFGSYLRDHCGCPYCKGMERHRAYFLFYSSLKLSERDVVLYFAPESSLYRWIKGQAKTVITADLFCPAHVRADLMRLPFKTGSVDIIIHHHVLEHVSDDAVALAELDRILKPDGRMFLSVPLNEDREVTWDWGFPDPVKQDHYRDYGRDFPQRLSRFKYTEVDIPLTLSSEQIRNYGLERREVIYSCLKPSGNEKESLTHPVRENH